MTTDNHQITVYLPPEILEYVEEYCYEKGLLWKKSNKPMTSTGVIELLTKLQQGRLRDVSGFIIKEEAFEDHVEELKSISADLYQVCEGDDDNKFFLFWMLGRLSLVIDQLIKLTKKDTND